MVALGGNALLERKDRPDAAIQREHIAHAARALAPIAARHELVICHGNGPQIGLLALESEDDTSLSRPYPLDALGAQTQGMIGYWLTQELRNAGVRTPVVTVVTQTLVDGDDPAFTAPTKFVGAVYPEQQARRLAAERGWQIAADGPAWRRVVASPYPLGIVELDSIRLLVEAGTVVVCGGGGGSPVSADTSGRLSGLEAVVDKDLTAARIALDLKADRLLLLTDVQAVMADFGTPHQRPVSRLRVDEVAQLNLPPGSMGPKVDACVQFSATSGNPASIGALGDAAGVLAGTAGTTITSSGTGALAGPDPPDSPDSPDSVDGANSP